MGRFVATTCAEPSVWRKLAALYALLSTACASWQTQRGPAPRVVEESGGKGEHADRRGDARRPQHRPAQVQRRAHHPRCHSDRGCGCCVGRRAAVRRSQRAGDRRQGPHGETGADRPSPGTRYPACRGRGVDRSRSCPPTDTRARLNSRPRSRPEVPPTRPHAPIATPPPPRLAGGLA